ncbi:MAG: ATP-grasp domain-containing protein [Candidatus Gracilibacteria bacterium]|nr:ATP-grasp domain-containing protein [Candidatus Gracilibacteria bacterium]MDD4530660.1 ATP-grasp domain-containing protein [Candidatus Gracilibacteria bacterium]
METRSLTIDFDNINTSHGDVFFVGGHEFLKETSFSGQILENPNGTYETIKNVSSKVEFIINLRSAKDIAELPSDYLKFCFCDSNYIGHSYGMAQIFLDKGETKKFLNKKGFKTSNGIEVYGDVNFIVKALKAYNFNFPVLVKEKDNTGGQGIFVAKNNEDILNMELELNKIYLLEEFIDGDEYSCNAFVNGNQIIIFPPICKGKTEISEDGLSIIHPLARTRTTILNEDINLDIRFLMKEIGKMDGVNGFIDLDFIFDKKDNILKIIEVNPRTSGATHISMFSADFDINKLIYFITNNDSNLVTSLERKKILIEYPIIHDNPDFKEQILDITGGKVIRSSCLRKFPPYIQKFLIEFKDKKSYEMFMNKSKQNDL